MPAPAAVGSRVRLVSVFGERLRPSEQLEGVVRQVPGERFEGIGFALSELVVSFPDPEAAPGFPSPDGFDFWPVEDVAVVSR